MKPLYKGLLLAVLHLAIVLSLGAKLLYDRATRPRVWAKVGAFDPNLPIRGRYLNMNLEVPGDGFYLISKEVPDQPGRGTHIFNTTVPNQGELVLRNGEMVAVAHESNDNSLVRRPANNNQYWGVSVVPNTNPTRVVVPTHSMFFLPEHALDPSRLKLGEELWVEVTVPRKGPPRPIRLGVKRDSVLTPLAVR
jgi:hypothetical protein